MKKRNDRMEKRLRGSRQAWFPECYMRSLDM